MLDYVDGEYILVLLHSQLIKGGILTLKTLSTPKERLWM